jgi:hypothetical protein
MLNATIAIKDSGNQINAEVDNLGSVPEVVFALSQHYGNGVYVVRSSKQQLGFDAGELLFRLTTEWIEDAENAQSCAGDLIP